MNGHLMNVYETRATNSLSFVHPNTGSDTQGMVNRWSVVEGGLSRAGTFKELYESNLQELSSGKDPIANNAK